MCMCSPPGPHALTRDDGYTQEQPQARHPRVRPCRSARLTPTDFHRLSLVLFLASLDQTVRTFPPLVVCYPSAHPRRSSEPPSPPSRSSSRRPLPNTHGSARYVLLTSALSNPCRCPSCISAMLDCALTSPIAGFHTGIPLLPSPSSLPHPHPGPNVPSLPLPPLRHSPLSTLS